MQSRSRCVDWTGLCESGVSADSSYKKRERREVWVCVRNDMLLLLLCVLCASAVMAGKIVCVASKCLRRHEKPADTLVFKVYQQISGCSARRVLCLVSERSRCFLLLQT